MITSYPLKIISLCENFGTEHILVRKIPIIFSQLEQIEFDLG